MAQSFACRSPCQNPYDGKHKLAGGTPSEGNNCHTPVPAATCACTPTAIPVVAPLAASRSADSSVVRYLRNNLQQILRTVLDSKTPAPVPASLSPPPRTLKAYVSGF